MKITSPRTLNTFVVFMADDDADAEAKLGHGHRVEARTKSCTRIGLRVDY